MNAYGIIHNFDTQNLYRPDFNFINSALSYKQTKYDANNAKLQNLYDSYSLLKVHNDVDQEYVEKRLEAVRDITNKYGSMDLSDDNFASSLMGTVSQVLDEKVKNAVLSTQLINAEDAQWAKMKESKPDVYSDLNRAYALEHSDRKNYESAEQAGTVYRGGAGFIEYRDLSKKLMENIPKLQDALKAKWVATGPQQGYFQALNTYESIDRNKMSEALDLVFDEKDKMQMGINGWGTYDKLPDEAIKQDWDSFYQPQKEVLNERLKYLDVLKSDPNYQGSQEELDNEISNTLKSQADIEAYTFESVANSYGREGAYRKLYNDKYKGQILDSYSYAPRLIDSKVDEVQAANVNYQLKVDQWRADYALKAEQFQFQKDKFAIEQANKAASTSGTGKPGTSTMENQSGVILGDEKKITPTAVESSILENQKEEGRAMQGMKELSGSWVSRDDFADLKKQFVDLSGKAKRGESVIVNGKKIKVDANSLPKLLAFENHILSESASEKEMKDNLQTMTGAVMGNLRSLVQSGTADMNPYELPQFTWKIEVDPKTKKAKKVPLDNPKAHNYVRLLQKKKEDLTYSEKLTLRAYTQVHMIGDEDLEMTPGARKELFKTFRDQTLMQYGGMSYKDFYNEFGQSEKDIVSKMTGYRSLKQAEDNAIVNKRSLSTGLTEEEKKRVAKEFYNSQKFVKPKMVGSDFYLSELTARDTEFYNKKGKEVSLKSFNDVVKDGMVTLDKTVEELDKQFSLVRVQTPIVDERNPSYKSFKALLEQDGKIDSSFKGGITVDREIDPTTGMETGKTTLRVTVKKPKGELESRELTVDNNVVRSTGFILDPIARDPYDAAYGKNAKKINLGAGSPRNNPEDYVVQNLDIILDQAQGLGIDNEVKALIKQYYDNQILFSVEADGGTYNVVARDKSGKQLPGMFQVGSDSFTYDDVTNMYQNSDEIASTAMAQILMQYMDKAAVERKLNTQQEAINNRLR